MPSLQLLLEKFQNKFLFYAQIMVFPPESKAGVHLILDLDEGVQHHGAAVVEVHLVLLHPGLVSRLFGVPSERSEYEHM